MTCFAQGSRSSLSYIAETTFGTTPAGNFTNLPFSTHSLNLSKDRVAGNDIQADRIPRVDRHGNRQVGGDIVADLRKGDYDDLLASAMLSDWTINDTLLVGTTPKYLSIEHYAADIDQARLFTGCAVSSLAVSIAPNQMVTTTFGIVGKDMTIGQTQEVQDAASGNQPFDSYSGNIAIGDVASSSNVNIVTSLDFTLTNSFSPTFVVGNDSAPCLEVGRAEVEGNLTAYFEDDALVNRFLNEVETEIEVSVDDPTGSNDYRFFFPRAKINTADISVDGPESLTVNCSFVALYDTTTSTNFRIRRTA